MHRRLLHRGNEPHPVAIAGGVVALTLPRTLLAHQPDERRRERQEPPQDAIHADRPLPHGGRLVLQHGEQLGRIAMEKVG